MDIKIRDAVTSDAERIVEIYAHYIENTVITYEYTVPTKKEFKARMKSVMQKFPYLVVEVDGVVEGYAYAAPYIGRTASDWDCETTIYLDKNARKLGLGGTLYTALEEKLREMGIVNLYAAVAYPEKEDEYLNYNSARFHEHMGYKQCGLMRNCGYKFGRWYHLLWMEKVIGEHRENQPAVRPYRTI